MMASRDMEMRIMFFQQLGVLRHYGSTFVLMMSVSYV